MIVLEIYVLVKGTLDKDQSNLEAISESNPSDAPVQPVPKAVTAAPVITRKKSVVSLRGKPSNENFPAGTAVPRREVSTSSHPSIREIRTRPRPLSVTGIPSPSPTRTSSTHTRKDKYEGITNNAHRRTASLRSVSGNTEKKLNTDNKSYTFSGRTIVPPRDSSKRVTEHPQGTRKDVPPSSKETSTASAHKGHPSKDASSSSQLPATTIQRPLKSQQSKDLAQSPAQRNNDAPRAATSRESSTAPTHTRQTSRDTSFSSQHSNSTIQRPLKSQPSKDFNHTPPRARKEAPPSIASRGPSSHPAHSRQSSRDIPSSSTPAKPTTQRPLKSQPSRDLAPPNRETPLTPVRKQRSKDLSPTPSSSHSSPKPKPKATTLPSTDPPPEQTRLLQLLHLIPLSETSLATYESSAHKTLSTRYASLQSRFQKIQEHDHAQYLTDTLKTLKLWSDGNIRTLFNLLTDWESLTIDFRGFCKRLSSTLKPINKSVLEEKGTPNPSVNW